MHTQSSSRVLAEWLSTRPPGVAQRMGGSAALPQNLALVSSSDNAGMNELFQPVSAASGFAVTDRTAMLEGAVYACLSRLAGAIVQLPVHHYRETPEGDRERVRDSALWWLLNEQPDPLWTAANWKEWIIRCVYLRGDQHTRIVRSGNHSGGVIIGFKPFHPDHSVARRLKGRNVYDTYDPDTDREVTYDQDDILHFSGFGFDGLKSISAIKHAAKQSIGNSLAAAELTGHNLGDGGMPKIALSYPKNLDKEQAKDLRDSFVATYGAGSGPRLPLVLTNGGTATPLSISPVDLDLIASRQMEKETICQVLGVPPVLIGDSTKASSWGTGIEQITLGFIKYTVAPLVRGWQEEKNRKVFRRAGQFIEFDFAGLMLGDTKAQSESFKAALGGPGTGDGYMTPNEVRRIKNLPPLPGGNELFKAQRGVVAKPPKQEKDPNEDQ